MPPVEPPSPSTGWRLQGNDWYKKGIVHGLNDALAKERLMKASNAYDRAKSLAGKNLEELSSATKNLGMTYWRIASKAERNARGDKERCFFYKQALSHTSHAYDVGSKKEANKSLDWLRKVDETECSIFTEATEFAKDHVLIKERIGYVYDMFAHIRNKSKTGKVMLQLAEDLFHEAVRCREGNDFKEAIYWLKEVNRPIEDLATFCVSGDSSLQVEVKVKKEEVEMELHIAESLQANFIGQSMFTEYCYEQEHLNMAAIFEVVDWFKTAALSSRGCDLEQEAIACHYIGYIHEFVFKLNGKAKEYYMQVLHLTNAARPRTFNTKQWYKDSLASIKRYQEQQQQRDDTERQKVKQKYLDALKDDLDKLKKADDGRYGLVKFLYETFPPKLEEKRRKFKIPSDLKRLKELDEALKSWSDDPVTRQGHKKELKKLLIKVVNDYHPDKNFAETQDEDGKKWVVFAEQITMKVNVYYECMK